MSHRRIYPSVVRGSGRELSVERMGVGGDQGAIVRIKVPATEGEGVIERGVFLNGAQCANLAAYLTGPDLEEQPWRDA